MHENTEGSINHLFSWVVLLESVSASRVVTPIRFRQFQAPYLVVGRSIAARARRRLARSAGPKTRLRSSGESDGSVGPTMSRSHRGD